MQKQSRVDRQPARRVDHNRGEAIRGNRWTGRFGLIWAGAIASLAIITGPICSATASETNQTAFGLGPLHNWDGSEIRALRPEQWSTPVQSRVPRRSRQSVLPGLGGHPRAAAAQSDPAPADVVLSNERTFTRWANVNETAPIYQHPTAHSRFVTRLHWYTEDGFPEVYLLLSTHWDAQGQEWVRLRIPMRPNGKTGWVRRQDLGRFHLTQMEITVNRARLRMYLSDNGHQIWSAPVAVGKPSTPTPPGHFWIREQFKVSHRSSGYWPYAFGTSDYSTLTDWPGGGVIGIHGPYYQPEDIPGRVSHGCIRLRVPDDAWLAHHVGLGTPIDVS